MSPQAAPLKDATLAAIASFLRNTGLESPASVVDEARGGSGTAVDTSFGPELQDLVSALGRIAEVVGDREQAAPAAKPQSELWVEGVLRRVGSCGAEKALEQEDPALSARFQQALRAADGGVRNGTGRRARVAASSSSSRPTSHPAVSSSSVPSAPVTGEPSAHYVARQPGVPDAVVYDPSIPDEYRDDLDPGYRIRELTEAELIMEIQEKYEKALAAAPELLHGLAAPGFGREERQAELAAMERYAEEDELMASPADVQAAQWQQEPIREGSAGAGGMDDELLQSESERGKQEEPSGGSMLADFVRNASSAVAAVGAAAAGAIGSGKSQSGMEEPAPPLADAILHGASTHPSMDKAGCEDSSQAAVPTFGAYPEGSSAASKDSAELQPGMPAVPGAAAVAGYGQAADGQPAYSYAQPPAAAAAAIPVTDASHSAVPKALSCGRKERHGSKPPCCYAESGDPFYPVELDGVVYDSFSLRVVHERDRTGFEESKDFPIRINSIVAARYQVLEYLGSAAFSRAVQCLDLQTNRMVCMKIIKNNKDFLDQSLDEIKLLRLINANTDDIDAKHCLALIDYFYHKEHLIIVTELLRDNLYEFSKFNREAGEDPYFTLGRLQRISKQVLTALEYIHRLWLIHADLKPENILIRSYSRCEVKVIDFGSSCFVDDQLTNYVQSRSYRAPEVMLSLPYDQKIDIWSLGCIIAELWTGYVLFQNDSIQSLLARIVGIIGPIPAHMMATGRSVPQYFAQDGRLYREAETPAAGAVSTTPVVPERRLHLYLPKRSSLRQRMRTDDEAFLDFMTSLLKVDPAQRPTAAEALQHPWLSPGRYTDGLQ
eukprot:TRINITY_DN90617_c0_g1_i1.p1 TRINITY_DN90617_c0_g1~~TRINITY_DN90617_c0_g1_i1.p1  ORF type:complete len:833 (+),score=207.59 TRINITY_DN90617_c0_g1_i1:78-2576(+)